MSIAEYPRVEALRSKVAAVTLRRLGLYGLLGAAVAFYLAPLETGLMTAFKTQAGFIKTSPYAPPTESFTVQPWFDAWAALQGPLTNIDGAMTNSLLFAVPATVISAFIGSITAYGLTKVDWRGQLGVLLFLVGGVFIPYQSVLVPLTRFWRIVGLQDVLAGVPVLEGKAAIVELIVTHVAYGVPIATVLFRSYYLTIGDDIIEAARLDGAGIATTYRRIILPLSRPMFAVALIYQFTNIWNDLLFALVLVNDQSNYPVTVALNLLQGSFVQQYNVQMAAAFLAALPTLAVYVFFGEEFARGVAGEQQ